MAIITRDGPAAPAEGMSEAITQGSPKEWGSSSAPERDIAFLSEGRGRASGPRTLPVEPVPPSGSERRGTTECRCRAPFSFTRGTPVPRSRGDDVLAGRCSEVDATGENGIARTDHHHVDLSCVSCWMERVPLREER